MRFHHYARTLLSSGLVLFASAALTEDTLRELGPHVHGIGSLVVAIEGNEIQMEFVAPGMDIVGFEHEADTARQKRAVEAALADLKEPLTLFELPPTAECTVTSAEAELFAEGKETEGHDESEAEFDEEHHHSEFRANYAFTCKDAAQVQTINFRYFDRFRDANELQVTFIDENGEVSLGVSRNFRYMER